MSKMWPAAAGAGGRGGQPSTFDPEPTSRVRQLLGLWRGRELGRFFRLPRPGN